ncbi:MAG TPA: hypothetical protein VGN69_06475 [Solirubrobacteraceae bacterium]|nr:hypothetical protein [Solirubrobacteraceae bacterium]
MELLVAVLLLTLGVFALGTVLASTNSQSAVSERQQAEVHRAQKEIERIQALGYQKIALDQATVPSAASSDPNNPLYYYTPGPPATFQYNQSAGATNATENVVLDPAGTIEIGPTPWTDGRLSGKLYAFVTWVTDPHCGVGCPASQDFKRITVEITLDSGAPYKPLLISSIVADPHASPAGTVLNGNPNPLANPSIHCLNGQGQTVTCTSSVGNANVNKWWLTDSPASSVYRAPSASHPTHATVAPVGTCTLAVSSGCPAPDLLNSSAPASSTPPPALLNYSNEQTGSTYSGGRALYRDVPCSGTPSSTDNTKGELWVSPALGTATTFTGSGGITLNTQTLNGVSASATLCVGIYDVPPSIVNLSSYPPIRLGVVSYTLAQWPTVSTPVSFSFNFLGSGTVNVPAVDRIGMRIWVDSSSGADIAAIYDHPSYPSELELESQ